MSDRENNERFNRILAQLSDMPLDALALIDRGRGEFCPDDLAWFVARTKMRNPKQQTDKRYARGRRNDEIRAHARSVSDRLKSMMTLPYEDLLELRRMGMPNMRAENKLIDQIIDDGLKAKKKDKAFCAKHIHSRARIQGTGDNADRAEQLARNYDSRAGFFPHLLRALEFGDLPTSRNGMRNVLLSEEGYRCKSFI